MSSRITAAPWKMPAAPRPLMARPIMSSVDDRPIDEIPDPIVAKEMDTINVSLRL